MMTAAASKKHPNSYSGGERGGGGGRRRDTAAGGLSLFFISSSFVLLLQVVVCLMIPSPGESLRFVVEPKSSVTHHGSTSALTCDAEPDDAEIRWIFNGSLVTTRRVSTTNRGRLVVNSSSNFGDGVYQCIANNTDGAILSLAAVLNKAYMIDFEDGLVDRVIEAIAENTVVIPCATPKGYPATVTEFERNSTQLRITSRHLILPSGNLQISDVGSDDEGDYRCIAINPLTGERRAAPNVVSLLVKEAGEPILPRFSWTPQPHIEVIRGQNLTLECVAEGWPVPEVTWKRYGGLLPENRSMTIWGNLIINDVQKQDEGTYICRAEAGNSSQQWPTTKENVAFIDVLELPVITLPPSDTNVTEFDVVTLTCRVAESERISVQWYHNAVRVTTSHLVTVSGEGLTLHDVQLHQSGIYQCFAENSVGVTQATARLIVSAKDENPSSDEEDIQNKMQNVAPSDKLSSGSPRPRKGKKQLKSSSTLPRSTPLLASISAVTDAAVVEVEDAEVPATLLPPSKPTVSKTSETSVLLNWTVTENGSLPVIFFKIQYKEIIDKKKSRWRTLDKEITPDSRSYEVLYLKSGATYQFRIVAAYSNFDNKNGPVSDRFVLKAGSLPSKAPVSSPMIVDVRPNVTSFVVVWQYVPIGRVNIEGFKVYYKLYGNDFGESSVRVVGSSSRKTTISGLTPDTTYSIRMTSVNSDGESNSSISVARRTLSLLEPSEVLTDDVDVIVEPTDVERISTTTTSRTFYATSRMNTYASNELLFIVLGVVLGIMMLVLCIVMVMCALKQRQQRRLMAALAGRRKFHDPAKTIYTGSHMKSASEGNFLLNGVGVPPRKPATNGYMNARGNGVAPGNVLPASEYELKNIATSRNHEEEVALRGLRSAEREDEDEYRAPMHVISSGDLKLGGNVSSDIDKPLNSDRQLSCLAENCVSIYQPPNDLPSISRPKDVPFQQLSLKSSRSSCDPHLHGNEQYPSLPMSTSPDHIPRLHECQALYRSPEHTRRARDRSRGRPDQVSDQSLSASSQASGGHLRMNRHLNSENAKADGTTSHPKITNILPIETHSSDADSRNEDNSENSRGLTDNSTIPISDERPRTDGRGFTDDVRCVGCDSEDLI